MPPSRATKELRINRVMEMIATRNQTYVSLRLKEICAEFGVSLQTAQSYRDEAYKRIKERHNRPIEESRVDHLHRLEEIYFDKTTPWQQKMQAERMLMDILGLKHPEQISQSINLTLVNVEKVQALLNSSPETIELAEKLNHALLSNQPKEIPNAQAEGGSPSSNPNP